MLQLQLLTRIVNTRESYDLGSSAEDFNDVDLVDLAGHSYGITSDPLTQFSAVFSAIIHDLDHPGVPTPSLSRRILETPRFTKINLLRNKTASDWHGICSCKTSKKTSELASTKPRKTCIDFVSWWSIQSWAPILWIRNFKPFAKPDGKPPFSKNSAILDLSRGGAESETDRDNRKATIIIEHLIQASDVSHTMQHWHVFKSWNEKLFMECYGAYQEGRADSDPSEDWYKSEIGFFDFYVIPLAKKLHSCGVFGVSSVEYLNYAKENREEWVREGEGLVSEYLAKYYRQQHQDATSGIIVNDKKDLSH
eukprot:scaffold265_cov131-Cylindrotheca_fusiformis.AAC.12